MAGQSEGVPGIAVAAGTIALYLIYAGIKNVPFVDGLRQLAQGHLPSGTPQASGGGAPSGAPTGGGGGGGAGGGAPGGLAAQIVSTAKSYEGVKYVWGGADPSGWDCSGFVTYVLTKCGVTGLPSAQHTTAAQFLVWGGAHTIPRAQCQAGDLCCWGGHIGIALDNANMVNAPTFGIPTREQKIYGGVTIRRLNGV